MLFQIKINHDTASAPCFIRLISLISFVNGFWSSSFIVIVEKISICEIMKIVNAQEALLSQYEVYTHLKADPEYSQIRQLVNSTASQRPGRHNRHNKSLSVTLTNSQYALYETVEYLEKMPCSKYTPDQVRAFLERMVNVPITKSERLQLLDLCPTTAVDLYPLIEEIDSRFPAEEDVEHILNIIQETLVGLSSPNVKEPPQTDMEVDAGGE